MIVRALKGLEGLISYSAVHWLMAENGWTFAPGPGVVPDEVNGARYLYEVYLADSPRYSGHATTPVLWDKAQGRIVNNESAEIIRMLNSAFDARGASGPDLYPEPLRPGIDALNARIYEAVNNGVYKAGFATAQGPYEEAAAGVFAMLDELEGRLEGRRYLLGGACTEADWRLFTTLIRFDSVYVGHFKCNLRRLVDYPALWAYARDLYQTPGVAGTVHFDHIKRHYYESHRTLNPAGIVPIGPVLDLQAPHGRDRVG
jgi:putative glutathione S-transferase